MEQQHFRVTAPLDTEQQGTLFSICVVASLPYMSIDAGMFPPLPGTVPMDYDNVILVLKDGTKITLFQSRGATDMAILAANRPIVLEEVDYLQMSDGTKLQAK